MLDQQDIIKLMQVLATKDDLNDLKETMSSKEDISNLVNSVDAYAKKADTYFQ